ncbi:MAG: alpha/beta hydrolase [Woeseia sp.]|jgi:alpha-beta hydrolase superfamily lysophospholipase|nr:alpha/beta hydrolase [Woeseia sp.]
MSLPTDKINAPDGHSIPVFEWCPSDAPPTLVIQVLHGLGEHAGRYERFAAACNADRIAVIAHNHRGHGRVQGFGHYADHDGWPKVISDVLQVRQHIAELFPTVPVVLLGHSMGSYIAQSFVMRHGGNNHALILSASTYAPRGQLRAGHLCAQLLTALTGGQRVNSFLNHSGLGKFNERFKPARTKFDWLSRDEAEVDRYIQDPLCGGDFSNKLWADLTGGLLEITSGDAAATVRQDLPILILGGERDPVGGAIGLTLLADVYRKTGHDDVTLKIYPEGRHEMLNETNRDEVTRDIIEWIQKQLGPE